MKIWFQVVSSKGRLPDFLTALQRQCDSVAGAETKVDVSGTPNGALGDHYAAFLHFDADEIIRLMYQRVAGQDYSAYAMANSLDPALDALRELLDIPVLSLMEVGCSLAPMLGDRFGVVVPNFKFVPTYRDLVHGYGLGGKLAGVQPLGFDRIADHNAIFIEPKAAEETIGRAGDAAKELVQAGAEVVMFPGPVGCLLNKHGVSELHGATVLDLYSTLVKVSEAMAYLAANCGMGTNRHRRYRVPPAELLREAQQIYNLG